MNLPVWAYTIGWASWALAGLALEIMALLDKRGSGDTLSEHIWWLLQWPPVWFVALGLLLWVAVHLLSGGRFA